MLGSKVKEEGYLHGSKVASSDISWSVIGCEPLVALMVDQLRNLPPVIAGALLSSNQTIEEASKTLNRLREGSLKVESQVHTISNVPDQIVPKNLDKYHDPEQRAIAPFFAELAEQYLDVLFLKVDVDAQAECSAAFVFFKTRYAALVASKVTQSSNPMSWATDLAPEPHDVYWSNLWIPYRQLWLRRIVTILGSIVFMVLFLFPVTLVQGLTQLDQLQKWFPFLKGMLKKKYISQVVTGYLPSVILLLFMYAVPPTMMRFSAMEGPISRSLRKRSACYKVLWFNIWNVFFVNVLSGSIIRQINTTSTPNQIPLELAKAVPNQITQVYGFYDECLRK